MGKIGNATVFVFSTFSRMRSIGFSFDLGGLGVKPCSPDVVQKSATVRIRSQPFVGMRYGSPSGEARNA